MEAFDIFFRRAKKNFEEKIGVEKTQNIFENLRNPIKLIPEEYKNYMVSVISKDDFDKRSEAAEELKERLSDLCENQKFVENMRAMSVSYNVKNDLDFTKNNAVY